MIRGKTKLKSAFLFKSFYGSLGFLFFFVSFCIKSLVFGYRYAGKQLHGVIRSAYKIERQAAGMPVSCKFRCLYASWTLWRDLSEIFSILFFLCVYHQSGLKDIIGELPRREASRFRSQVCRWVKIFIQSFIPFIQVRKKNKNKGCSIGLFCWQVSDLASEAKRERNALTKEVTKISNYGISV